MEVKIYDTVPNSENNMSISAEKLSQATTELSYLSPINYSTFEDGGLNFYDTDSLIYESNDYIGYCSNVVSDTDKKINVALTVTPTDDFVIKTDKISIEFFKEYCSKFKVTINYENNYSVEKNIENDNLICTIDISNNKIVSIAFNFTETQYPNSFIKIAGIYMGKAILINKFLNFNIMEEINVISSDCSINQFEFSGVSSQNMNENAVVMVTHNNKLYGKFYAEEVEQTQKNLYNVQNQDLLGKADKIIYDSWNWNWNGANNILQDISQKMNIKIVNNVGDYFEINGYIRAESCRFALTQLAWAIGGMIDDSRNDYISINPVPTTISSIISSSDNRIIGDAVFKKSKTITKAKIHEPLITSVNPTSGALVVEGDFTNPTKIYFDDIMEIANAETAGTTILDKSYNYVVFTSSATKVSFAAYKYKYIDRVVEISNTQATSNDEENILDLSNYTLCGRNLLDLQQGIPGTKFKYDQIQKYIQSKGTIKAKIVLKNEKVGDLIKLETAFSGTYTGIITSINIVSLGYQNIADIEVLEWQAG